MEAPIRTLATRDDIANGKYELSNKIANSVKWMFVLGVGQVVALLAILILLFKK